MVFLTRFPSQEAPSIDFRIGAEHPRVTTVSAEDGSWEVTADLSTWADLLADGIVKRVEIGILPALVNADGMQVALDATSKKLFEK